MSAQPVVTRIGNGAYCVEHEGRAHIVHVAGPAGDEWLHWNGQVFERPFADRSTVRPWRTTSDGPHELTAPMPATVIEVRVAPGATVRKGDTLVVLEAMKMELPVRSVRDAVVRAVHCRVGDTVQAAVVLVELE